MIDTFNALLVLAGSFAIVGGVVFLSFRILNLGSTDEPTWARSPDAWRVKRGNRYYYSDKAAPGPGQDVEPLFTRRP